MQFALCGNSHACTLDVLWFYGYNDQESQAERSVNTSQGQEVCDPFFPDRPKRTAVIEKKMTKRIVGNSTHVCTSQLVQRKL